MKDKDTIGFIGLGNVGSPIAERIIKNGFDLIIWNRSPMKMQPLLTLGATGAQSANEVGQQANIILICVDSASALEEILFGPEGIVSDNMRVSLIVDISTLPPQVEIEFGQRLRKLTGAELIDAPFSGGPAGARAGTLTTMVGCETSLLERVRPTMESHANCITHMGPLGAGQVAKACNQIISVGTMGAIAEAIALQEHYEIDTQQFLSAVSGGFADSNLIRELKRSYSEQDSSPIRIIIEALTQDNLEKIDPQCQRAITLVLKDLRIAIDIAKKMDSPMPLTTQTKIRFQTLQNKGDQEE